jgi:DNA-binding response OmpR family regulator
MDRRERQRVLPYEDGRTERGSDARHWLAIYRELVAFQEEHLARLEATGSLDRHWRPIAEATQQLDWLRARSAFWLQRCIVLAGLVFQPATRRLEHGERGVTLTRREAELFEVLVRHPGQHFGADQLINQAWNGYQLSPEQLRVYVARLRRRLVELGTSCRLVHEPGQGYGLVLPDD